MRTILNGVIWLVLLSAAARLPAAPPKVNYFFPLGVQRGQKPAEVTVNGTLSHWPVKVWVNRPGLQVVPAKDKGKLNIQADQAAHGVFLMRLYDREGAAAVRPFFVDAISDVVEKEPNDLLAQAPSLGAGGIVNGRLGKAGDVDTFAVEAKAGQTIVACVVANRIFGSPMDAVVQICDQRGFVLDQNDDSGSIDPLANYVVPRDGVYHVRVFAFPETPNSSIRFSGADTYLYRLTITSGAFIDFGLPLAVADKSAELELFGWNLVERKSKIIRNEAERFAFASLPSACGFRTLPVVQGVNVVTARRDAAHDKVQAVELPVVIGGQIEAPGDTDVFEFSAKKAQSIELVVASRSLGFPLDPVLQVRDGNDRLLQESDDVSRQDRDARLTFKVPADGKYRVEVRDLNESGGMRFAYRLRAQVAKPDYSLSVATDQFVVEVGKPLELSINVDRRNGFGTEIEVQAVDLPPGVTAAPVVAKGSKSAPVKLKLTATQAASGPFRVIGKLKSNDKTAPAEIKVARFLLPKSELSIEQLWMTAIKK